MPRQPRVVAVDVPHHITQRGNNRQTVFHTDDDRLSYLDLLRQKSHEHGLSILGWCLMPNHVHIIAVPTRLDSMALGPNHLIEALAYADLKPVRTRLQAARRYGRPLGDQAFTESLAPQAQAAGARIGR